MRIEYTAPLASENVVAHLTLATSGDITNPDDVEFIMSLVTRLMEYERSNLVRDDARSSAQAPEDDREQH